MANTEYYNLITSEYVGKPLFRAYLGAFLDMVDSTYECLESFKTIFNINNAVGDQLDKLGALVGISRNIPLYDEDVPSPLTDELYREVIKSKILMNHWDGTIQGLQDILEKIFPNLGFEIIDNQNMSYEVLILDPTITDAETALLTNGYILPKPSGVKVNYSIEDDKLFGFDLQNSYADGWDIGVWKSI